MIVLGWLLILGFVYGGIRLSVWAFRWSAFVLNGCLRVRRITRVSRR